MSSGLLASECSLILSAISAAHSVEQAGGAEAYPYAYNADEQTRHNEAELVARLWQTDCSAARYIIYREPEYADSHPPLGLDQLLSKLATGMWIRNAVVTDTIQKRIRELQDKHAITIAEIAYDPDKVMEGNIMVDPFTFNNY